MPDRRRSIAVAWTALTVANLCLASWIAFDTIRTVVSLHSPLPWFDDWNTMNLFRDWNQGIMSATSALLSQFGEHRLFVPRLVFFADDLYLHGQGWLPLAAIFLVQAGHAALFSMVLARFSRGGGRWAVAGIVVALMFSLRQAPNFSSSFQLQFVGVFAAATLSMVLFGRAAARAEAALPVGPALAGSLLAAAVSTFCMANGLLCGLVLVALAVAARLRARIAATCGIVWLVLAVVYLDDYQAATDHTSLSDALRRPWTLFLYSVTYLGSLAGPSNARGAAVLGCIGVVATAAATVLVIRRQVDRQPGLALLGVLLFCGASALVTASGRLGFGIGQALEERYVTASVTFWSAQVCFWWVAAPFGSARAALAAMGAWLAVVLVGAQAVAKPALLLQRFVQDDAADLLLLGLDDAATIRRTAWTVLDVQQDLPVMREARISIFGSPLAGLFGRPVAEKGDVAAPEACTGEIRAALADPGLGRDGVRVEGQGWDAVLNRRLRRILLVDDAGIVVGLAASGDPRSQRSDWRGFAVARPDARLTAYGAIGDGRICRLGTGAVTAAGPATPSSEATEPANPP